MKIKTKIIIVTIAIFSINIAFIIVSNNIKFNNSLNDFKKEAVIDYRLRTNINKNRNINKICDVIVDFYRDKNELYIEKLGEEIHSSTYCAYSEKYDVYSVEYKYPGTYKLTIGMKNLSDCVVNSKYVKDMNFEDKIKIKMLLHADIEPLSDYDFGFIKFTKEEIDNYIEDNKVEIITECNKGGYYDSKCPSDSEDAIKFKYTKKYAFEYIKDSIYVYELNNFNAEPTIIYKK